MGYRSWHRPASELARQVCAEHGIDISKHSRASWILTKSMKAAYSDPGNGAEEFYSPFFQTPWGRSSFRVLARKRFPKRQCQRPHGAASKTIEKPSRPSTGISTGSFPTCTKCSGKHRWKSPSVCSTAITKSRLTMYLSACASRICTRTSLGRPARDSIDTIVIHYASAADFGPKRNLTRFRSCEYFATLASAVTTYR